MGDSEKSSQESEVAAAMKMLGIDPKRPMTQDQVERIKGLVWKLRKEAERKLRAAAKNPTPMGQILDALEHKGVPESKPEEILMWAMSQRSLLTGEFKPQIRVGPFFVDFGFERVKLAVEVDGREFHTDPADMERDRRRSEYLASCGWTVIRFSASDVMRNAMTVADKIAQTLTTLQADKRVKEAWER